MHAVVPAILSQSTGSGIAISRIVVGAAGAAAALGLLYAGVPRSLQRVSNRSFDLLVTAGFALLHLAIFLPLLLSHTALRADVVAYYLPQARQAMAGKLPYIDFESSYQPLHPFIDALVLRVWNNGYALLLLTMLCDVAALPFWMAALRRCMPETAARCTALLVMTQPLVLWNVAANGRNDAIIFLLLGMAAAWIGRSDFFAGVASTAPLVAVKFLPIILLPQFLAAARRKSAWLAGAALLPVVIFGFMLLHRADLLQPLKAEGVLATAGGAPYAWTALTGWNVSAGFSGALLGLAYLCTMVWLARAQLRAQTDVQRVRLLLLGCLALMLTLLFFSKKSFPMYLIDVAVPLAACAVECRRRGSRTVPLVYAALLFFSLIQSSLWFGWMGLESAAFLHRDLVSGSGRAVLEVLVMTIPAACYLWLLVAALRMVRSFEGQSAGFAPAAMDGSGPAPSSARSC